MNQNILPKHVHVIGICGVATSALAIAFQKAGVKVTGSDKGFFPPVSTELEKHGINFYAGWHPENISGQNMPDVVVVGTASGSQNPETVFAIENKIKIYSFAEAIGVFFTRKNNIVATGTWGKTSSSTLISFILKNAGLNPTYMFGGVSLSHDSSAELTNSDYAVFEGDEYKSSPTDNTPKFFYYKSTHLLLTAISWDHADLYPTEESYFNAFRKLIQSIPDNGLIVANADHPKVTEFLKSSPKRIITYRKNFANISSQNSYVYDQVKQSANGLNFTVTHAGKTYNIHSPMIGKFQTENITGCFAMAHSLGIKPELIITAISQFKGLKRRMEKRSDGSITVFDDIAHSPEKAISVLENLRSIYTGKIITIFEPNIGGRSRESALKYDNAFKDSDIVIIPRLTKLKVAEDSKEQPMEGDELANTIRKTHANVQYINDDDELVNFLKSNTKTGDVIAFLGSHGFRGMIEETVKKISN